MIVSRRSFTGLLGAGLLTGPNAMAKLPPAPIDCVIVGAGAAGIAAARRLREKGRRVILLEARQRIGGRAWTDTTTWGLPFDRGAAWIEHLSANPLRHEVRRLGIATLATSTANAWMFEAGRPVSQETMALIEQGESAVLASIAALAESGEDKALSTLVANGDPWQRMFVDISTSATTGTRPDEVSALDLALRRGEGDTLPAGGMGALLARLATGLDVRLGTPVSRIDASGRTCRVETGAGTIECRSVLVTLPTDLIVSGTINFAPGLAPDMLSAFASLKLGTFEKVAFRLSRSLHAGHDFAIAGTLVRGGQPHAIHVDPRFPVVTVLYGADCADTVRSGGEASKRAFGEAALRDAFGSNTPTLVEGPPIVTDWRGDPYSAGSYAAARPGQRSARSVYRANVAGRVFFAGEADDTGQSGSVGGAWLSGMRAADDIAART